MNRNFIANIAIDSIAVFLCALLLPGVEVEGWLNALFVALALALLNQFVKPLLIILTIPATIFTFGLFLLVINALIILLADKIVVAFEVRNFWWALLFSFVFTLIKSVFKAFQERPAADGNDER